MVGEAPERAEQLAKALGLPLLLYLRHRTVCRAGPGAATSWAQLGARIGLASDTVSEAESRCYHVPVFREPRPTS
jgi:hypothetical protein